MTKEEARLLRFFLRYVPCGWHSIARTDRRAITAMRSLAQHGILEIAWHGRGINPQARIALQQKERELT